MNKILYLISQNNVKQALDHASECISDTDSKNDVIGLQARYNKNEAEWNGGRIRKEEYDLEYNRILKALEVLSNYCSCAEENSDKSTVNTSSKKTAHKISDSNSETKAPKTIYVFCLVVGMLVAIGILFFALTGRIDCLSMNSLLIVKIVLALFSGFFAFGFIGTTSTVHRGIKATGGFVLVGLLLFFVDLPFIPRAPKGDCGSTNFVEFYIHHSGNALNNAVLSINELSFNEPLDNYGKCKYSIKDVLDKDNVYLINIQNSDSIWVYEWAVNFYTLDVNSLVSIDLDVNQNVKGRKSKNSTSQQTTKDDSSITNHSSSTEDSNSKENTTDTSKDSTSNTKRPPLHKIPFKKTFKRLQLYAIECKKGKSLIIKDTVLFNDKPYLTDENGKIHVDTTGIGNSVWYLSYKGSRLRYNNAIERKIVFK